MDESDYQNQSLTFQLLGINEMDKKFGPCADPRSGDDSYEVQVMAPSI